MLLAGDIGGTKTTVALFESKRDLRTPVAQKTYASSHYASLEAIALDFVAMHAVTVTRAAFGVAGPVVGGQSRTTNLPWLIDAGLVASALGIGDVRLINDLGAIASAVPMLQDEDLATLNQGAAVQSGAIAVIAPGTGLGEAFLTWNGTMFVAHESEGGHADFAPTDQLQGDLLRFLQVRYGHVSCERVCSGIGLPNIFAFLRDTGAATVNASLSAQLDGVADPTPLIVEHGLAARDDEDICARTLRLFVTILGSEAGNLALKVLATGGVYLGGGIPPRILDVLKHPSFLRAFQNKGRLRDILVDVPVHVILNPTAALLGAAVFGFSDGTA